MQNLPNFQTYCNYSSQNYGAHALRFTDAKGNNFYFSYKTLVAFEKASGSTVVRQNDWSTTTGKHLNAIDGGSVAAKKKRIPGAVFEKMVEDVFGKDS